MAKRYIDVKYQDKDLAKRLGARWDAATQRWYCPAGSQLAKIFAWRAEAAIKTQQSSTPKSGIDFFQNHPQPLLPGLSQ